MKLLSQIVSFLGYSFPGWGGPAKCRLYATIGATGAVTASAAKTTPGVTIVRDATAQYTVSFPKCRDISEINVGIYSVAPETEAAVAFPVIDANSTETGGTVGQFKFHCLNSVDGADDTELANGDILDITFLADFR